MIPFKRAFALVLVLALLAGIPVPAAAAQAPQVIDGSFTYRSAFLKRGDEAQLLPASFHYDENWFLGDSSSYNHQLATMSLSLSMSAAMSEADSVKELYDTLQFSNLAIDYPAPTWESIGYAIGSKVISGSEGTFTLVAVAVRGGGYEEEWADNFRIGTGDAHQGFRNSADKVLSAVRKYLQTYAASGEVKIWLTGYSRGAAVANLTAHDLNVAARAGELAGVAEQGIYAYCFEVPRAVKQSLVEAAPLDTNIFNINNPLDLVARIAPAYWEFTTYGITYHYPSPSTNYKDWETLNAKMQAVYRNMMKDAGMRDSKAKETVLELTEILPAQQLMQKQAMEIIATYFQSPAYYTENYQDTFMEAVAICFGDGSDIMAAVPLVYEILPFMIYQHRELANQLIENVMVLAQMHYPELSFAWMNAIDGSQLQTTPKTRQLTVNGSADIALYDSTNTLVAKIAGGKVSTISGSVIEALVDENGQQILSVPLGEAFRLVLTPRASVLSWQVEEYDEINDKVTTLVGYDDMPVTSGTAIQGTFPAEGGCTWEGIAPTRQAADGEVQGYSLRVYQQGGKDNTTGGGYFTEGEYALVTARPRSDATFYGWYDGEELVSTQKDYRFRMEKDLVLTAWFEEYKAPDKPEEPVDIGLTRVAGDHRYETSFQAADRMKAELGIETFKTVVVASGTDFADALSGSYLASVKQAPILLAYSEEGEKVDWVNEAVKDYIRANLAEGGTVYILGGTAAVPTSFETGLEGFKVKRLAGNNRFDTNLLILKEAGVLDKSILVCTGIDFADSLSASATKQPILMVYGEKLTKDQAAFMESVKGSPIYIIGGTNAVSEKLEKALTAYGNPKRLAGTTRFQTSVLIAEEFFRNPEAAVVAYAGDFPDGLCGGPLATTVKAPLLLVAEKYEANAAAYLEAQEIGSGIILGGTAKLPEITVDKLFPKE